jgi:hypothetical protein
LIVSVIPAWFQVLLSTGKEGLTTTRVALRGAVSVGTLFSNESRLAVGGALNVELAHPVAKGIGMDIQTAMDFEGSFAGAQFGGDLVVE